ncbi:alkaline phosphatase family protein [bacterium]|nr:alkaline phosphatase family protein [bacterium]MCI0603281.1 alkaline phosphatase family protein [bacterium]
MAEPRLVIVGQATQNSARLLAVFDPPLPSGSVVHLFSSAPGYSNHSSALAVPAPPYSIALLELTEAPASFDGTLVQYSVESEGNAPSARKRVLKLLPAGKRPLRIGLLSCNGIFRVTDLNRRYLLWRELKEQVLSRKVDLLIHAGDQIYADSIYMRQVGSVAASSGEKLESLTSEYRQIYFDTWCAPDIQGVLESCPSFMMWDDHDIYDGYGSHSDDASPLAQTIFAAAKKAFWEFQAQKNPDRISEHSFAFSTTIGDVSLLMLDGRTNRMWKQGTVVGNGQLADIENCLDSLAKQRPTFLVVITAVPFLHVPVMSYLKLLERVEWKVALREDLRDSWTASNNQTEGLKLLSAIFRFISESPGTRVLFLCGDVHVATVGELESTLPEFRFPDGTPMKINQVVSSGIGSPAPFGIVRLALEWAAKEKVSLLNGAFLGQLRRLSSPDKRFLLSRRNFAILEFGEEIQIEFFADYKGSVARFKEAVK